MAAVVTGRSAGGQGFSLRSFLRRLRRRGRLQGLGDRSRVVGAHVGRNSAGTASATASAVSSLFTEPVASDSAASGAASSAGAAAAAAAAVQLLRPRPARGLFFGVFWPSRPGQPCSGCCGPNVPSRLRRRGSGRPGRSAARQPKLQCFARSASSLTRSGLSLPSSGLWPPMRSMKRPSRGCANRQRRSCNRRFFRTAARKANGGSHDISFLTF